MAPRRQFFRLLLSEAIGLVEEIKGKPQMRLSDLDQVPDDVMRQMAPVFNKDCLYRFDDNRLLIKPKETDEFQELYRFNAQEMSILQQFDKQVTLAEIGRRVAQEFGQNEERAYQQVKTLFLMLAKRGLCHPAQAHELNEE